jgi:hypothetical protein
MRSFTRSALVAVALVAATASTASAQVCQRGVLDEHATHWETSFPGPVTFVGALPPELAVEQLEGGVLVTREGRIVGVAQAPGHLGAIRLRTREARGDEAARLEPPLVVGPQRVVVTAADRGLLAFTPAASTAMETYVGYHATPTMGEPQRRFLDAACGESDHAVRIYVDASSYDDLGGAVARGADRGQALVWLAAFVLVLSVGLGLVGYRRLSHRAKVEYADAMLDKRFREIERGVGPGG